MARDPRTVKVLPVCSPAGCRSYVVVDPATREACVVDPLLDQLSATIKILKDENARLAWALDTHSHADHLSGAALLKDKTGCEVVSHPGAPGSVPTMRVTDGHEMALGEVVARVRHAPGITHDALVLEVPGALFTGDTLLIGTVGLRDAPGSDPEAWFETLHRIFDAPDETTVIHPGHDDMGRTQTTLRQERTGNGWLREDDYEAFLARYEADDRPTNEDAAEILDANRTGLDRVPAHLRRASGLVDPAHATEAALRKEHAWEEPTPRAARPSGALEAVLLLGGLAVVIATVLGLLVHDLFHALAGLVGVGLVAAALHRGGGRRRRKGSEPSLFYEGPERKTVG